MDAHTFPLTDLVSRYDGAAHGWHAHLERLGFPRAYRAALTHLGKLPDDAHVLDAGVGTGALSLALAGHAKVHVTGIDLSRVMLSEAARRFRATGISARLLQGDVRSLHLENQSCDAVLCAHVLEHLAEPKVALQEFHRVLKPGAPLFLSVTRKGLLGAYIAHRWGIKPYLVAEMQELVEAVGFREVRFVEFEAVLPRCMSIAIIATKGTK